MNLSVFAAAEGAGLGNVPIVVLGVYLCMLLGLGLYGFLKSKMTEEDYYLAGRQQGFLVTAQEGPNRLDPRVERGTDREEAELPVADLAAPGERQPAPDTLGRIARRHQHRSPATNLRERLTEIPVHVAEKRRPSLNLVRRVPTVLRHLSTLFYAIRLRG